MMRVLIVGASGKSGQYMVEQCLEKGYEVVGVCREQSVSKLDRFKDRMTIVPGATNDSEVIKKAVGDGVDGVLAILIPHGTNNYSSGTAKAVLEHAPNARLVFTNGTSVSMDGKDEYRWTQKLLFGTFRFVGSLTGMFDMSDQERAADMIFKSDANWTVVRGVWLEEGESEGIPVYADHMQEPVLNSGKLRRVDYCKFLVECLRAPSLIHQAPIVVSCASDSAKEHGGKKLVVEE